MLINVEYKGKQAYAFTVYNFSQVQDAVLLVMADKKREKSTLLFTHVGDSWQTSDDLSFFSAESFQQINNALIKLFSAYMKCSDINDELKKESIVPEPESGLS